MSRSRAFFAWVRERATELAAIVSACSYVAAVVAMAGRDPLWTWLLFTCGTILLITALLLSLYLTEIVKTPLLDEHCRPISKKRPVAPPWVVWTIFVLLGISPGLFIVLLFQPHNTFAALFVDDLEVLYANAVVVDGNPYFAADSAYDDETYKPAAEDQFFLTYGFFLKFLIEKAHRHEVVAVERIVVTVVDYTESDVQPPTGPPQVMPFREHNLYYVEIDDPAKAGRTDFVCDHFFQWVPDSGGRHDAHRFAAKLLEHDRPESIVLKVEANAPGLYSLDIKILASVGTHQETIMVSRQHVLFPKNLQ